jgi:environmental stress-induced protein Ves
MSAAPRAIALDPAHYRRAPWKNGGGVTVDIADAYRPGTARGDWDGVIWRFGRTAAAAPGPFSDLSGYDRILVVVAGRGLVLETPDGEIDVRAPFKPVRFRGETPIMSRLEAGPVEVVNLMADRTAARLELRVLAAGGALEAPPGTHVVYAPSGPAAIVWAEQRHALAADHALRLDTTAAAVVRGDGGIALLASILPT